MIDYWPEEFDEPRRWGAGVLLVEYPGYGRSEGSPSQASISEAMLTAYEWARHDPRVDASRIIPLRPLARRRRGRDRVDGAAGSGVDPGIVVLERCRLCGGLRRAGLSLRDKFDSVSAIKSFKGPILILHGDRDDIVPPHHARALAAAASNATLKFLPCGHNDCPRPWADVRAFLDQHGS